MRYIKYWMSCNKFTIQVDVINGIIVQCAPIVRKFKGQKVYNLQEWMIKLGGFRIEELR